MLREVCECVSNSGVERSPSLSLGIPGLNLYSLSQPESVTLVHVNQFPHTVSTV